MQSVLQISQGFRLALENQRWCLFAWIRAAGIQVLLKKAFLSARHMPVVVSSLSDRNDSIAFPYVTNGGDFWWRSISIMRRVLVTLQTMTINMMGRLSCSLQCPSTGWLR